MAGSPAAPRSVRAFGARTRSWLASCLCDRRTPHQADFAPWPRTLQPLKLETWQSTSRLPSSGPMKPCHSHCRQTTSSQRLTSACLLAARGKGTKQWNNPTFTLLSELEPKWRQGLNIYQHHFDDI